MDFIKDWTYCDQALAFALAFYVSISALLIRQHVKIENAKKARRAAQ